MIIKKLRDFGSTAVRFAVNDVPARLINGTYNAYSMIYRGANQPGARCPRS
jgi:hypothetical protein